MASTVLSPMGSNALYARQTPGKGGKMDRFIANRAAVDFELAPFALSKENAGGEAVEVESPSKAEYKKLLAASLNVADGGKILAFKTKAPAPPEGYDNAMGQLYTANAGAPVARKAHRHVPQTQERILDAPDLVDDYYLNLLDWSCQNTIAIALGKAVYLWNAGSGGVEELCAMPADGDYISSLQWAADGSHLAVGTSDAKVQIWDVTRMKQVRELAGHTNRVSAVAWNGAILSSGGRDSIVCNWDVRVRKDQANVATLRVHEQEVCGLKWSPSGTQLASGGNDNVLAIHDAAFGLQHKIPAHQAAVKALAWCPFQSNLLATGGGTADRCIKFWNTVTGACTNSIDTGSQVCALQWNRHEREILSSHGYSKNQLCLWKYPSMGKVAEMTGHSARVLHMAQSPDGTSVVTAGADETLRFWRCFGEPVAKPVDGAKSGVAGASAQLLRTASLR